MLLSYNKLVQLVEQGVIDAEPENINGASIDITLGENILIEVIEEETPVVDLQAKQSLYMIKKQINSLGYMLPPKKFILAESHETFNLPNNITCEFKLKSSLARSGLNHVLAGWCDPGWYGSKLTLELMNVTSGHQLLLKAGMKIGQMVFFECEPVPEENSYAVKGQYNNDKTVTNNKGVR